jgi:hypothetical protein
MYFPKNFIIYFRKITNFYCITYNNNYHNLPSHLQANFRLTNIIHKKTPLKLMSRVYINHI